MVSIKITFYASALIAILIAYFSGEFKYLVYLNSIIIFFMLYLQIISIPLNLNWSRLHHGILLKNIFFFIAFTGLIYAWHFHSAGLIRNEEFDNSILDAIYFSFTTWTTLGYGDISTVPELRLATSVEALTGILTSATVSSMIWLYCQDRLIPRTSDSRIGLQLRLDDVLGGFIEIPTEKSNQKRDERRRRLMLYPCVQCGNLVPEMEVFYDIVGRLAPFPNFVIMCKCGEHTKYSKNAYLAAYRWNNKNYTEQKKS